MRPLLLLVTMFFVGSVAISAGGTPIIVETRSPAVGADGRLVESVGLETIGGVFTPLLEVGCLLPCTSGQIFTTAADFQSQITISLFRGTAGVVAEVKPLGRFRVEGIPPMGRGLPQVSIVLSTSGNDLVLEARDASTREPYPIVRVP